MRTLGREEHPIGGAIPSARTSWMLPRTCLAARSPSMATSFMAATMAAASPSLSTSGNSFTGRLPAAVR